MLCRFNNVGFVVFYLPHAAGGENGGSNFSHWDGHLCIVLIVLTIVMMVGLITWVRRLNRRDDEFAASVERDIDSGRAIDPEDYSRYCEIQKDSERPIKPLSKP